MNVRILLIPAFSLIAQAAGPVITELQPRGAEYGKAFTLTINGRDLGQGVRISSTLPAAFTAVNPIAQPGSMMTAGNSASFLVEPNPGAAPGIYPIRIQSSNGISNVLLFTLGSFPEITEQESQPYTRPNANDSIESAEPIQSSPIVVNGTLRGAEKDVYRVYGKAGERRIFEIEARRIASAIDPVLAILDGNGKQLARSDDAPGAGLDPRIDFTFPREGNYYVEVHDARYSRQGQNFYRLKMGSYAYADGMFPLGGRRGESPEVTFYGPGLSSPVKSKIDLHQVSPEASLAIAALPNSPALPFNFAVSDLPELMEPVNGAIPIPSVVNGRLSKPGEIDRYQVKVAPGDKLLFELQARELGTSRLEGIITVYDDKGKKLDSAGDKPLPEDVFAVQGTSRTSSDPFLNITVPAGVNELTVAVDDLAERGGPAYGYRLITRREAEDFRLFVGSPYVNIPAGGTAMISVNADRRGYDGPIQLSVANLPPGITVDGGYIPREFIDASNTRSFNRRGILTLTAEPGVELPLQQLTIIGEGKLAGGEPIRRRARGPGLLTDVAGATAQGVVDRQRSVSASWLNAELPAAVSPPAGAVLEVKQTGLTRLPEGGRYEFEYFWKVRAGTPPKDVNVDVVGAKDIRVIDMKPAGKGGTFVVTTTKATDPSRYDLYISGRLRTDSGDENIVSRPIPFEVTEGSSK